jgi:NADH:ubiquinone oxidoreductase subunit 3 (subunit A)
LLSTLQRVETPSLGPLESGFEGLIKSTLLSSPYFLLAVLFVLFDIELILLVPGILSIRLLLSEIRA